MAKASRLSMLLWAAPIIASTTYSHLVKGPPAKSWTLKYNLLVAIIRTYITGPGAALTPEKMQHGSLQHHQPLPKLCTETELVIDPTYLEKSIRLLQPLNLPSQQQQQQQQQQDLQVSWITHSQETGHQRTLLYFHGGAYFLGTYKLYRPLLGKLSLKAGANVLAVNYRLAPQNPFPAALEDALAAYLYLLDPPAPLKPIPAADIVISGDSAGGGLTMALLLTIRDQGLPMPGGAILISPWIDLTHSLPSCQANELTDYLPVSFGTRSESDQLHLYAPNHCLKHYLVSPLHDPHQWHGLPPLLIQTGNAELLRDESICASFKATNTFYDTAAAAALPLTHVTLDIYDDQPHVFQLLLPTKAVDRSINTMAAFLNNPSIQQQCLMIRSVTFDGHVQDVTQDMIKIHQGDIWQDWLDRLDNPNMLKTRLEKVAKL
ncbi:Alpha/Beta hydrolase protein [Chlamydoabsidia padenii]|nr:Alpha/Beta hydrolase protein [Chlamydoabsidia padenii]